MREHVAAVVFALGSIAPVFPAAAQASSTPPVVHFVWMGGDDCPPCVNWRRFELPKLKESPEFEHITFSYVPKPIASSVPAKFFLPSAVASFKDKLDQASAGQVGSPQGALIVDGEVYDYFHGSRTAEQIERMLKAVRTGSPYPFARCQRMSKQWGKCATAG